jgi:hypothetical protein
MCSEVEPSTMVAPSSHNQRRERLLAPCRRRRRRQRQRRPTAAVCLMTTLVVAVVVTIGQPNQDSVLFLVSDHLSHDKRIDVAEVPKSWVREKSKMSVVAHHVLPNETSQQSLLSNALKIPKLQYRSNTVTVVYGKDIAVDYSTHTEFQGTYFDQSPDCTGGTGRVHSGNSSLHGSTVDHATSLSTMASPTSHFDCSLIINKIYFTSPIRPMRSR